MIDLTGKVAVITGGSRGIGRATVKLFVRAGAKVAFTYNKHKKQADSMVKELGTLSPKVLPIKTDISKKSEVKKLVKKVIGDFGTIDILVNNAGIWTYGKIDKMSEKTWDETMDVNLKAIFYLCREIVPVMKKKQNGRIINISSTAGQRGEADHSHYAASKGAIISLTKSLAAELGPSGIRVNSIAPGWVETDMTALEVNDPGISAEIINAIPLGYIPSPEEIAGPILFLASDLANHINGEILNVNGGSVLCG